MECCDGALLMATDFPVASSSGGFDGMVAALVDSAGSIDPNGRKMAALSSSNLKW